MSGHSHVVLVHEQQVALAVELVVAWKAYFPRVSPTVSTEEASVPASIHIAHLTVVDKDAVHGVVPRSARFDVFCRAIAASWVGRGILRQLASAFARYKQLEVFSRVAKFRHYKIRVPLVWIATAGRNLLQSLA